MGVCTCGGHSRDGMLRPRFEWLPTASFPSAYSLPDSREETMCFRSDLRVKGLRPQEATWNLLRVLLEEAIDVSDGQHTRLVLRDEGFYAI
jgi:hypothetical protein